jgi:hypothetical protein
MGMALLKSSHKGLKIVIFFGRAWPSHKLQVNLLDFGLL